MIPANIEKILLSVEKPSRYSGGELFQIIKDKPKVRIAISYPDLYEIGMANHGVKILYAAANNVEDVACERVFAAAPDFSAILKESKIPLYTLESFTPLSQCTMIAFNVSHELLYTNILQILDLGNIPLYSHERSNDMPIVMGGGEAISNYSPLSPFLDCIFVGEGDEAFSEIAQSLKESADKNLNRTQTIDALCRISGVYRVDAPVKKRRVYRGNPLDPVRPVIPSTRISQDRGVIEVMRGCSNLCKFCHAGYFNLPHRAFDPIAVADRARELIKASGYNEITFLSLSISDYKDIIALLNNVLPEFNEQGISVSLPSLKVDLRTLPIISLTSDIRKSSLTFAIETGSEDMRRLIYKNLSIDEFTTIVENIFSGKWDTIKIYFMIGLPGFREYDEAAAIIDLLFKVDAIGRKRKKINATISPFIPKPHTPFEREEMADEQYLLDTVRKIKSTMPKRIAIKNHFIKSSRLEGLLARGDAALSNTIVTAYKKGAVLDSWDEHSRFDLWDEAIKETIPDIQQYYKKREATDVLPWSSIDTCYDTVKERMISRKAPEKTISKSFSQEIESQKIIDGYELFKKRFETKKRYRFVLSKTGRSKYISHLDFIEIVKRGLRIINAPISFSQGFNKHERISAGFPLPLGAESHSELLDADMWNEFAFDVSTDQSNIFPEGIKILSYAEQFSKDSIMALTSAFKYHITVKDASLRNVIHQSLSDRIALHKKDKAGTPRDVRYEDAVLSWECTDDTFTLIIPAGTKDAVRIDSLITQLALSQALPSECIIVKKAQLTFNTENNGYLPIE
jgi:radical SAM-linked protein